MSRSWNIYLKDILGAIQKIEIYTQDLDFLSFCQDERTVGKWHGEILSAENKKQITEMIERVLII
jgi:uncharacterized protein with HEPN domain